MPHPPPPNNIMEYFYPNMIRVKIEPTCIPVGVVVVQTGVPGLCSTAALGQHKHP